MQFVLPEMGAQLFLTVCFLLSFQIIALLLNVPLAAWNVNKYVPSSGVPPPLEFFPARY